MDSGQHDEHPVAAVRRFTGDRREVARLTGLDMPDHESARPERRRGRVVEHRYDPRRRLVELGRDVRAERAPHPRLEGRPVLVPRAGTGVPGQRVGTAQPQRLFQTGDPRGLELVPLEQFLNNLFGNEEVTQLLCDLVRTSGVQPLLEPLPGGLDARITHFSAPCPGAGARGGDPRAHSKIDRGHHSDNH